MSVIVAGSALAYVNFGRWIADCPLGCGHAVALEGGQTTFYCTPPSGCGHIGTVVWPGNAQEIWEVLGERPMPKTRNWFPEDHPLALMAGCPHGQSVQELRDEAAENGVT